MICQEPNLSFMQLFHFVGCFWSEIKKPLRKKYLLSFRTKKMHVLSFHAVYKSPRWFWFISEEIYPATPRGGNPKNCGKFRIGMYTKFSPGNVQVHNKLLRTHYIRAVPKTHLTLPKNRKVENTGLAVLQ